MSRLADFVETRANPLMLKETYQGVRGATVRVFGGIMLLIPLAAYTVSSMVFAGEDEVENPGRGFFVGVTSLLCFVGCLLIPLRAAQQLNQEIKTHTLDLIVLTQLSAWQLAVGRFQAAAIQVLLVFAYALPFATAAIAMGGVSMAAVVGEFVTLFLLSLLQCSVVLAAASTLRLSTRLGSLAVVMTTMLTLFSGFMTLVFLNERSRAPDVVVIAWLAALLALGILLCLRLATDTLTVSVSRTYALSKVCLAVWLAAYFMPLWLGPASNNLSASSRVGFAVPGIVSLYLLALFFTAAPARASRGTAFWRRLVADGHETTVLYCAAITAVISGVAALRGWPAELPILSFVQFAWLTGIAALVHSFLRDRSPEQYFAVLFAFLLCEITGAGMSAAFVRTLGFGSTAQVLVALFPFSIHELHELWRFMPALSVTLAIGLGATAWARRRNARRVVG